MNINAAPIVLLAALCCIQSVDTQATNTTGNGTTLMPSTTTTLPVTITTTPLTSTVTSPTIAALTSVVASPTNATTAVLTSAAASPTNATTAVLTSAAASPTNATTAVLTSAGASPTNATTAVLTSAGASPTNATTATPTSATASSGNATTVTANNTAANSNATTIASNATTTAASFSEILPNATVVELVSNISRDGCGSKKLCADHPKGCDPTTGSCFFVGVKQTNGRNLDFELAGESDGYLGCTLKSASGKEKAYLCVKSGGKVIFIGASVVNGTFTNETLPVNSVKAKMNGKKIQCSFAATVPNATAKADDTKFEVSVVNGTYDPATGQLGKATALIKTNAVDLTNVAADTNNTLTNSTTTAPVGGTVPLQSMSSALLVVLGTLSLAWL